MDRTVIPLRPTTPVAPHATLGHDPRRAIPDRVLRTVADGKEIPNFADTRAMAEELLAFRAMDRSTRPRTQALQKFDIIMTALTRCFVITGERGHVWHVASVCAAILDETERATPAITARDIEAVLQHLGDDPTRMLYLDRIDDQPVLRGLRGQGAAA